MIHMSVVTSAMASTTKEERACPEVFRSSRTTVLLSHLLVTGHSMEAAAWT